MAIMQSFREWNKVKFLFIKNSTFIKLIKWNEKKNNL